MNLTLPIIEPRRVLWAANVRNKPLLQRLAAARSAGYSATTVFPIDYARWRGEGWSDEALSNAIRDSGIEVAAIDPYTQWTPNWALPAGYPQEFKDFVDYDAAAVFHMAEVFGARTINCVESFGTVHTAETLASTLGDFADQAAERGLRVALEFMPLSGIVNLSAGWAVVERANRSNLGLVFDVWHHLRSGGDSSLLEVIPLERIFEIQLADGLLSLNGDLMNDLLHHRLPPGDGEMPVVQVVAILQRIGAWRSVGPEVFSDAFDAMSAEQAAREAAMAVQRIEEAARGLATTEI